MNEQADALAIRDASGLRSVIARVAHVVGAIPPVVWIILILALLLRLMIAGYGLPQELYSEEQVYVRGALRMIGQRTLDPGWYGHPASTLMDGLAAVYAIHGWLGVLSGASESISAVAREYRADVSHFFLVGRVFTTLVGVAGILVTYALARELRVSAFWAAVAALLVTLSALMIRYAATVRSDMLQILFMLLMTLIMVRALSRPAGIAFVIAGACLGLSVASKYPGLLGVVPILAAAATLTYERRVTPLRAFVWLVLAAVASLVATFVAGPYLFINLSGTLAAIGHEARNEHLGATSEGILGALWEYVSQALPMALGLIATTIGVVGAAIMLADRRARLPALLFWAYLLFISVLSLWWERWILPLVPIAAIAAAYAIDSLEVRLRQRRPDWTAMRRGTAVRVAVLAVLVLPMLIPTLTAVWSRATNDDTRVVAAEWVESNVPEGATLLIESLTPSVRSDRYELLLAHNGKLLTWPEFRGQLRPSGFFGALGEQWCQGDDDLMAAIEQRNVDYILLSGSFINRYERERASRPCSWGVYDALLKAYPVIDTFDREDAGLGDPVLVLRAGDR